VVLPGCLLFAAAHAAAACGAGGTRASAPRRAAHVADAVECLAVPALALALPPFLSFLAYFCLLHSARHAMELAAALAPADPRRAWTRFARAALPATLATVALAAVAWLALRGARTAPAPATARVLFAGLAALTAPHMLLTALAGDPDATSDTATG
jgi:Brp/Blh family beta-carotene 15,15'-monooxygenase